MNGSKDTKSKWRKITQRGYQLSKDREGNVSITALDGKTRKTVVRQSAIAHIIHSCHVRKTGQHLACDATYQEVNEMLCFAFEHSYVLIL